MKRFTIKEVEALIPEIERVFEAVKEIQPKAEAKAAKVRELEKSRSAGVADLAIERAQLEFLVGGINDWLNRIVELGGEPKGIDPPLVDFIGEVNGREVYLCWRVGEKKITHYHGVEEGFAGRKPLP